MDYNKAALALHSKYPGKIAVQSLAPCKNRDALSTACFVLGLPMVRALEKTGVGKKIFCDSLYDRKTA